jgi:hypothetical protein
VASVNQTDSPELAKSSVLHRRRHGNRPSPRILEPMYAAWGFALRHTASTPQGAPGDRGLRSSVALCASTTFVPNRVSHRFPIPAWRRRWSVRSVSPAGVRRIVRLDARAPSTTT